MCTRVDVITRRDYSDDPTCFEIGRFTPWHCIGVLISLLPAHKSPDPQHTKKTLWEHVADVRNQAPEFWGRYISPVVGKNILTVDEVHYLWDKGCFVLPIFNDLNSSGMRQPGKFGAADGENRAIKAMDAANILSIPNRVFIYANIDADAPTRPARSGRSSATMNPG